MQDFDGFSTNVNARTNYSTNQLKPAQLAVPAVQN